MWLLESDGNLFDNKKVWLRPGRSFLFGRTNARGGNSGDRGFNITHRGVSRKHLVITVGPVETGHGSTLNRKSRLTITDDSKFGTTLDGEKFSQDSRVLEKAEHSIKLGSWDQVLKVTWRSTVLTTTSAKKDASKAFREKLEPLEVKVVSDFLFDQTTHVIATKRNVPKVLQALVSAKYVVTDAYIDAIVNASISPGVDEDGETPLPSLLEQNYEANWPDPMDFVPPTSNEPIPREPTFLNPDKERLGIFDGFTFVFCTSEQHTSLEPAISLGGAKCPLFPVQIGTTSARELTDYVRHLAGKSSNGNFNSDSPKGVVVVRIQRKEDSRELVDWTVKFSHEVDQDLEQRSIVQNEFLDAILTKNTDTLKQSLREEDDVDSAPPRNATTAPTTGDQAQHSEPPAASRAVSQQRLASPQPESQPSQAPPSRIRGRRAATRSRFKGFDDFGDDAVLGAPQPPELSQISEDVNEDSVPPSNQHQRRSRRTRANTDESQPQTTNAKKRPAAPDSDNEPMDAEAAMEAMFPGAQAMKKRRLEQGGPAVQPGDELSPAESSPSQSPSTEPTKTKAKGKGKVKKEDDIRTRAKEHASKIDKVKEEDEGAGEDPESIAKLRDLALIEEMDVPRLREKGSSSRTGAAAADEEQGNWEPACAGRKNFKRFRRKGGDATSAQYHRSTRVIVPLEEFEENDNGIGDRYWMSFPSSSASSKKKKGRSQSQSQSQAVREAASNHGPQIERDSDIEADEAEQARLAEVLPEEIAGRPREAWVKGGLERTKQARRPSGTEERRSGKRSASESVEESPFKKRRQAPSTSVRTRGKINLPPVEEDEDESDEDELKFRLRK